MTFSNRAAVAAAFAAAFVSAPVCAQSGPRASVQPASSVCIRDLGSSQCGRYQDRLVEAAARHTPGRSRPAAVAEIGRRQLDVLIASIS